jgi:AcrR family transcriptional regulator
LHAPSAQAEAGPLTLTAPATRTDFTEEQPVRRSTYTKGTLRAALVDAATTLIAEKGVDPLSVSELTRRLGVSSGAPYQHFTSREDLLAATAAQTGRELAAAMSAAVHEVHPRAGTGAAPADALAATAVAYATFVAQRRVGFEFIFADELTRLGCDELTQAGQAVIDVLLPLTLAIAPDPDEARRLMEHHIAAAHGLGALSRGTFPLRRTEDLTALGAEAARITHTLATAALGHRTRPSAVA